MSVSTDAAGAVIFDYAAWSDLYPDLSAKVTSSQAQAYFDQAGALFLKNNAASPVRDPSVRAQLLGLLTAHLATLNVSQSSGGNGAGSVGRIASATRGSVSVSMEFSSVQGAEWYQQTQYGATYWQATARSRQMRFVPGRPHPARIWP